MNRHWLIDWYEKAVQTVSVVIDRKLIYAEALLKQPEAVWATTDETSRRTALTWLPYLFCGEQGLVIYWHIGNKRNANAIVARTEERRTNHSSETRGRAQLTAQHRHVLSVPRGSQQSLVSMLPRRRTTEQKRDAVLKYFSCRFVLCAALTCRADGEDHLYRVEEEEHDEQRHRGAYGQEQGLCGVYSLNTCNTKQHKLALENSKKMICCVWKNIKDTYTHCCWCRCWNLAWGYRLYPSPGSHSPCLMICRREGKRERVLNILILGEFIS